jgi:hypothetical protein
MEAAPFNGFALLARITARTMIPTTTSQDNVANPFNALAMFIVSPLQ